MEELVNIPALPYFFDGVTKFQGLSVFLVWALIASRNGLGKSGPLISRGRQKAPIARWRQLKWRNFQEKLLELRIRYPYCKPTQVGESSRLTVNERALVKELGKKAAVSSQEGLPCASRAAAKEPKGLFTKNIAPC